MEQKSLFVYQVSECNAKKNSSKFVLKTLSKEKERKGKELYFSVVLALEHC